MTNMKNVSNGVKTEFSLTFNGPLVSGGASMNLLYVRIYRNDGTGWKSIAGRAGGQKGSNDPLNIDVLNVQGLEGKADGNHVDKTAQSGKSYRYQIWAAETANLNNPNCTDAFSIKFLSGGENEEIKIPPCPTKVTPVSPDDLPEGVSVDWHHVYLKWEFSWEEAPTTSDIVYVLRYLIPDGAPDNGKEFTTREGLVQLYGSSIGAAEVNDEIVINALDKTSKVESKNCKSIKIKTDQVAGVTQWIDQDGNIHNVAPGEFVKDLDKSGCSIFWILSGFPPSSGPSQDRFNTDLSGTGISAIFSRLTVCVFDAIVFPALTWAAGLVKEAAGISWYSPAQMVVRASPYYDYT